MHNASTAPMRMDYPTHPGIPLHTVPGLSFCQLAHKQRHTNTKEYVCLRSRLRPLRLALNGSTRLVDGRKCSVQNPASAVFAFRLCSHGAPGDGSRSTFRRFRVSPLLARRPRRRVSLQLPPSSRFAFARAARATTPASKQAAASKQTNKHASNSSCMQTYQQPSTDPSTT